MFDALVYSTQCALIKLQLNAWGQRPKYSVMYQLYNKLVVKGFSHRRRRHPTGQTARFLLGNWPYSG